MKKFPKYSPMQDFGTLFVVNMASGGLAAARNLTIECPPDYARTRFTSDVGSEMKNFQGFSVPKLSSASPRGTNPYRGFHLSASDIIVTVTRASTYAAAPTAILLSADSSHPFETVRRRHQMLAEKRVEQLLCKGTADRLKKIATEEVIAAGLRESLCSRPLSHAHRDGFARTDLSDVPHEGALASMVKKFMKQFHFSCRTRLGEVHWVHETFSENAGGQFAWIGCFVFGYFAQACRFAPLR